MVVILLMSPQSNAWLAGMVALLKASSAALPNPTRRGRKRDTPESGTKPMPAKPTVKREFSDAMRRSHARAIPSPAPAAGPLMLALIGLGVLLICRIKGL